MATCKVMVDIEAQLRGDMSREDIGGEVSVWATFIDDVELDSLWMFGRDWSERELRLYFGDQGATALIGLIKDQAEDWEDD